MLSVLQPDLELDYDVELAASLLKARLNAGLSQTELAQKLGTSQSNVSAMEHADRLPSHAMIKKIAKVLGMVPVAPRLNALKE